MGLYCWNIETKVVNWIEDTPSWTEHSLYTRGLEGVDGRLSPETLLGDSGSRHYKQRAGHASCETISSEVAMPEVVTS